MLILHGHDFGVGYPSPSLRPLIKIPLIPLFPKGEVQGKASQFPSLAKGIRGDFHGKKTSPCFLAFWHI